MVFLPPPYCYFSLIGNYIFGETFIGVCIAVVVELFPTRMRASAVGVYIFVIQNIGGNMEMFIPPLRYTSQYRCRCLIACEVFELDFTNSLNDAFLSRRPQVSFRIKLSIVDHLERPSDFLVRHVSRNVFDGGGALHLRHHYAPLRGSLAVDQNLWVMNYYDLDYFNRPS